MQDQLIPVVSRPVGSESIPTVNARELHTFLEVGKDFSNWIKDRIDSFSFVENQDFVCSPVLASEGRGGHNRKDYHLSLDMAKELSMVERNAKGKQARQYFIECERVAKSVPALPTDPMAILRLTFEALEKQQQELSEVKSDIQFIKDNVRLHAWQCKELQLAVNVKVNEFHKMTGVDYKQLYPGVWNKLKLKMQVNSYQSIPAVQFDNALAVVTAFTIRDMPDYVKAQALDLQGVDHES